MLLGRGALLGVHRVHTEARPLSLSQRYLEADAARPEGTDGGRARKGALRPPSVAAFTVDPGPGSPPLPAAATPLLLLLPLAQ